MSPAFRLGLFILLCLWILLVGLHQGGIIDDAYIFCRYANNLVHGNGLVFNQGERVEGFTSFTHILVISLFFFLGVAGRTAALASSFLTAFGVVFVLIYFSPLKAKTDCLRAALLCCSFPFLLWAASGMDECLLLLGVTLLFRSIEQGDWRGSSFSAQQWFIAGLMFTFRPEGLLVYLSLFLVSLSDVKKNLRATIRGLLVGAIPIGLLTTFRLLYFGSLLPNTFHAKAGGAGLALFIRGAKYGAGAMLGLLPLLMVGVWGMIGERMTKSARLAMVLGLLLLLGTVAVGGDAFPFYRFAIPLIPLLSIFAAPRLLKIKKDSRVRHFIVFGFLAILIGWTANPANPFEKISEIDRFVLVRRQAATWELVGDELPRQFGGWHSLALTPIGAIGYRSRWLIIDLVGLIDKHTARLRIPLGNGMAGHEKYDARHVLAKKPDFILLHTWLWTKVPSATTLAASLAMNAENEMISHPLFIRDYLPVAVPISKQFLVIYKRKDII